MPELPEVETVKRGMEGALWGLRIESVETKRAGLRIPFPPDLPSRLQNRRIISFSRRAKYILMHLDDGQVFALHLGMSGRIRIDPPGTPACFQKHDHLILSMEDGARAVFNDSRRFGMAFLIEPGGMDAHPAFSSLGPEPLDDAFDGAVLFQRLKGRNAPIKQALLDQRVVAGIGNIYACEALYDSGIHPARRAARIGVRRVGVLASAIRAVLNRAIAAGGSSLRDHRGVDGAMGYFQHGFSVYGREGEACPACDCALSRTGGIKRLAQGGRSTFFCPRKQT